MKVEIITDLWCFGLDVLHIDFDSIISTANIESLLKPETPLLPMVVYKPNKEAHTSCSQVYVKPTDTYFSA